MRQLPSRQSSLACWAPQGRSTLDVAHMHGCTPLVDWLLEQGAQVSTWAAHSAASQGDAPLILRLLANGWSVDTLCKEEDATIDNISDGSIVRRGRDWPVAAVEEKFKVRCSLPCLLPEHCMIPLTRFATLEPWLRSPTDYRCAHKIGCSAWAMDGRHPVLPTAAPTAALITAQHMRHSRR